MEKITTVECVVCGVIFPAYPQRSGGHLRKHPDCCSRLCATRASVKAKQTHEAILARLISSRKIIPETQRWEWTKFRERLGYGVTSFHGNTSVRVHRLILHLLSEMPIDSKAFVCHKCDNPSCFNPDHLYIGTPASNVKDRDSRGRHVTQRGEQQHNAKLTDEKVREIRAMLLKNQNVSAIARHFEVGRNTIRRIKHGEGWQHVN